MAPMDLKGKGALVTGAGIRVGNAIALALAKRGADVAIHYNSSRKEAAALARKIGGVALQADLSDPEQCQRLAHDALKAVPPLAVLVNSASVFPRTPWDKVTREQWENILAINLRAPFILSQIIGPAMKKRGAGKIINITDWSAVRPYKHYLPYVTSKGALIGLTQSLAVELAPEVQVNAISPGPVLPPADMTPKEKKKILAHTPLKRFGSPEDVAQAVLFLAEGTDYATGSIVYVEGGRLIA